MALQCQAAGGCRGVTPRASTRLAVAEQPAEAAQQPTRNRGATERFPSLLLVDLVGGGGHQLPIHAVVHNRFDLSIGQFSIFWKKMKG